MERTNPRYRSLLRPTDSGDQGQRVGTSAGVPVTEVPHLPRFQLTKFHCITGRSLRAHHAPCELPSLLLSPRPPPSAPPRPADTPCYPRPQFNIWTRERQGSQLRGFPPKFRGKKSRMGFL
ncbi:hypothetical protein EVAR_86878_1 [Eumeta japonica]|uniref:Uncharacterized protein n=1 Tax=Eumeta variegata TaxID=151549 RepID=A0A4C1ZFI5_EUMVA|nr:hypothetical protein EVAR_86878_1 [Eumeta japonica]